MTSEVIVTKSAETPKFKLPKTQGACADLLYTTQKQRLDLQKKVEELRALEYAIECHFIDTLPKADSLGVSGRLATVRVKDKEIVELVGTESDRFAKVYEYILKNGRKDPGVWSLLQRRVGDAAAKELIKAGKGAAIGAKLGTVPVISLTKL